MKFLRLMLVPFALACVLIVRLSWPRLKIRFGTLWMSRIGHLAGNTEVYLCEREVGLHAGYTDLWVGDGEPASAQLYAMLRRAMPIGGTFMRTVVLCNKLFAGHERHTVPDGNIDRDPQNLLERTSPHLAFTPQEEARGQAELRRMGIPSGAKFVCLIVRDSAYLPELAYHAFRDCDVDTYLQSCIALARRGYYVLRMGAKVAKRMPFTSPHIIDYATNGMYSDFMTVYLGAKCEFCISSGCGFDAIPVTFRRPVCYTNYVPLEYLQTYHPRSLAIWKHHERDGKRMTLAEIYESKAGHFMRADEFERAGIKLVDNTADEIRAVVEEMVDRAECPYKEYRSITLPQDELDRQAAFWRTFPRSVSEYTQRPLHGKIRMRIGREFLRDYQ